MTKQTLVAVTAAMAVAGFVAGWFLFVPALKAIASLVPAEKIRLLVFSPYFAFKLHFMFALTFALFSAIPGIAALSRNGFRSGADYRKAFFSTVKIVAVAAPLMVVMWALSYYEVFNGVASDQFFSSDAITSLHLVPQATALGAALVVVGLVAFRADIKHAAVPWR